MGDLRAVALVREVVEPLMRLAPDACCAPEVEFDRDTGRLRVVIDVAPDGGVDAALQLLELCHALQYVADMAQVRAIVMRYQLDPASLMPAVRQP